MGESFEGRDNTREIRRRFFHLIIFSPLLSIFLTVLTPPDMASSATRRLFSPGIVVVSVALAVGAVAKDFVETQRVG